MRRVIVLPYEEKWKAAFDAIRKEIDAAAGDLITAIVHVGSTAVEGLPAKPCIDIDVVIADRSMLDAVIGRLAEIGYIHEGNLGIEDREAFRYADKPHLMNHHLYVCPMQSAELHRHITFRDFLRANPDAAQRYGAVKTEAARLYPTDIDGYIRHKTPCIEALYAECGLK